MSEQSAEARSIEFVKLAALAAMQINALNTAIETDNMDAMKSSVEFGRKVSESILNQVPEEFQMEILLDVLSAALGE